FQYSASGRSDRPLGDAAAMHALAGPRWKFSLLASTKPGSVPKTVATSGPAPAPVCIQLCVPVTVPAVAVSVREAEPLPAVALPRISACIGVPSAFDRWTNAA